MSRLRLIDLLSGILFLTANVFCFTLQPELLQLHYIPELEGIGVTSVLPVPMQNSANSLSNYESMEIYLGTKRGKILRMAIRSNKNERGDFSIDVCDVSNSHENTIQLKPYPVYSMITIPKWRPMIHSNEVISYDHDLLAGGGDRYVTVWETTDNSLGHEKILKVKQQLGPHTGWVRCMASSSSQGDANCNGSAVFSIGCNCIEVWFYNSYEYKHICKIKIDSSVEMGSTLSSDLLCLAAYHCDDTSASYLLAGGVDGRLHRWMLPKTINNVKKSNEFSTAGVIAAHNGRVNKILVCKAFGAIVSVDANGYVICRKISSFEHFEDWETETINLVDESSPNSPIKLTSACIINEDLSLATVSVGSSCGCIFLVQMSKQQDKVKIIYELRRHIIISKRTDERCNIHSMCSIPSNENPLLSSMIAIGHSNGCSLCLFNGDLLDRFVNNF